MSFWETLALIKHKRTQGERDVSTQLQRHNVCVHFCHRNYKATLMELERLYSALIEVEDCEKKLSALPTGTAMRKQVTDEKTAALSRFHAGIKAENRLKRYLLVRKGKALLKRCLRHLDTEGVQIFCSTIFQLMPVAIKRDKDDQMLSAFWPDIRRHLRKIPLDLALHYMKLLNSGGNENLSKMPYFSTFKQALTHELGVTSVLYLMHILSAFYPNAIDSEKEEMSNIVKDLTSGLSDAVEIAKPLEKVDLGSELPWENKQITRLTIAGMIRDQ